MAVRDAISRQLSNPQGLGGRVIAALMNRGNAGITAAAIDRLALRADARALEIGFGGGASLGVLLERASQVTGVDRAPDMVSRARRARAAAVAAGRLDLREGDVTALPFEDGSFDAVLSVNTVYFWPELEPALAEIHRVLTGGGRVALGIRDPSSMRRVSRDVFTLRPPEEVRSALEAAGFVQAAADSPGGASYQIVTGRKG